MESLAGGKALRIKAKVRIAPPVLAHAFLCEYVYTLFGSGDLLVEVRGEPQGLWPDTTLPRIGLELALPVEGDRVQWFGRGPGESYSDTKLANRFGLWKAGVDELYTPYIFPQENGNRTEVTWVSWADRAGTGLLAVGAALAAPKPVQFHHGRKDASFCPDADPALLDALWNVAVMPGEEFAAAFTEVERAYRLAAASSCVELLIHNEGHRVDVEAALTFIERHLNCT